MSYDNITQEHVLSAIDKIEKENISLKPSTQFDVIINGKAYPPKEVMRYANFVANGSNEWPFSGGEPTNKFLRNMDFDITSKTDETEEIKTSDNLVKLLKKIGVENATEYFESAYEMMNRLSVKTGDLRVTYGTSSNTRLAITIGQRYCLAYMTGQKLPWQFINDTSTKYSDEISVGKFNGVFDAYYYRCAYPEEMINRLDEISRAAKKELDRTEISGYRKHSNRFFEKAIFDLEFRNEIFQKAFGSSPIINNVKTPQKMGSNIDLFVNTILYGPPGTGKTFKLNEYKESYFTDYGISKTPEELLRDAVSIYPYWKIFAAALSVKGKPTSVGEILAHPLVQAKISKKAKTPQNTIWRILQSYADGESTQMNEKYKGPIELFHKNSESEWSIIEGKKAEIQDIVDTELLDLSTNPVLADVQSTAYNIRYNFITFHQKYSYEDFIEGIKPLLKKEELDIGEMGEDGGALQFELKKGIFYKSCLSALELAGYSSFSECEADSFEERKVKFDAIKTDPQKQFALFIDEINRANISAVLGELITLLEDDKRIGADNELWLELPYSNEKICVPPNLFVIGTMNTADRSIALLDIALRRRFEFKALYPFYDETAWWGSLLRDINEAIYKYKNKNPDFFVGHAFFINRPASDRLRILNTKIIPLLYEYCQNNADTLKKILSEANVPIKQTGITENFQIIAE